MPIIDIAVSAFEDVKARITQVSEDANSSMLDLSSTLSKIFTTAFFRFGSAMAVSVAFEPLQYFRNRHLHDELCLFRVEREEITVCFPEVWLNRHQNTYLRSLAHHVVCLIPILMLTEKSRSLSGCEFLFELGDSGYLRAVSFSSKSNFSCLIPDPVFFSTGGYRSIRERFSLAQVAWAEKKPQVFWRGSSTGQRRFHPDLATKDFDWLSRLRLVQQCERCLYKTTFDVGISEIVQVKEPELRELIKNAGLLRSPVPKAQFLSYKGLIDIDGNSNSWSGLYTALLSGSCVFKVTSEHGFRQWFYEDLKPFYNYLPLAWDLCDLDEAAEWFTHNDDLARGIGVNGRLFAERLSFDDAIMVSASRFAIWSGLHS